MSSTKIITMRVRPEEHDRWKDAAGNLTFNAWARRALNEAADYDAVEGGDEPSLLDVPSGHRCPPRGVYCKGCGK